MSVASIIDARTIAANLRSGIAEAVTELKNAHGLVPGLAVVLVGDDPASQVYVRNKSKHTLAVGMRSFEHRLPSVTTGNELLELVEKLNNDPAVHGILVQLPLPDHIDSSKIIESISPRKDVDGLHPLNAGYLALGQKGLVSCTPLGSMMLIRQVRQELAGLHAVIIGRSQLVGKPVAQLLLAENCTVTITHSRTRDIEQITRQADILVAAVGRPEMVKGSWIKPGAIVIDVGINRVPAPDKGEGKTGIVGDVSFAEALEVAGAITPVPGGVGLMTVACLLYNTLQAACSIHSVKMPDIH